ncbi:S-adenosyl-L-methionine-dependent methyltransferase [Zopfia rhizophila CBS 207.26]|uniref:S-adenosyl-L-methionine-dependent methyltransferase n=1 Tax=Zopfia rhizophila CBS 207.26 TaxID=1314779 RepID=A0A6A6DRT1_9PEZI|nr:S-adenosyl-L-methionine-dependent methyltransferase [Zopfia rhizophila CBS 207.26]
MIDPSEAASIATKLNLLPSQTRHRIELLNAFGISPGDKVLELGCGQGDCTALIAHFIGPDGHVDAVDPAPLDYGSPFTLRQAQEKLKVSEVGEMITFHQAEPLQILKDVAEGEKYDAIVLCHCIWYFSNREEVSNTLKAAKGRARKLCIAEWSLSSPHLSAQPHILAALTRGTCEAHIPDSDQNIRSPLSPSTIMNLAKEAGWKVQTDVIVSPGEDLEDAKWEIGMIDGRVFVEGERDNSG